MNFTITIQPANIEFKASSAQTILAAALAADVNLPYGCQGGACGACMVGKVSGEIRYPGETPPALQEQDQAAGQILCCQAFACSDVVLNVPVIGLNKDKILTLPTRVVRKTLIDSEHLCLTLKLPGQQTFPDFIQGQQIEILAGAGKTCTCQRLEYPEKNQIKLEVTANHDDSYVIYLFKSLKNGEMLRIRGPI